MVKLIIFDLDETLLRLPVPWDAVKAEVISYGRKEGVEFDEDSHIISLSSAISNTPGHKKAVDSIWRKHEVATLEHTGVERYPKAEEFVRKLRSEGLKLAIASNNCHETIEKALVLAGMREFFNLIVGRDDVLNTKPAPDMLLKIAWKFKLEKKEIIFIGDSDNDMKAANAAGIRFVLAKPNSDFSSIASELGT